MYVECEAAQIPDVGSQALVRIRDVAGTLHTIHVRDAIRGSEDSRLEASWNPEVLSGRVPTYGTSYTSCSVIWGGEGDVKTISIYHHGVLSELTVTDRQLRKNVYKGL